MLSLGSCAFVPSLPFSGVWIHTVGLHCYARQPGSLQVLLSEQGNILLGPLAVQFVLGLAQPVHAICILVFAFADKMLPGICTLLACARVQSTLLHTCLLGTLPLAC